MELFILHILYIHICIGSSFILWRMIDVLVSCDCSNKSSHIWWFTTEISLSVLKATNPKLASQGQNQGVGRLRLFQRFYERFCSLPLLAWSNCWRFLTCGHIIPIFASVVILPPLLSVNSLCCSLRKTHVINI